MFFFITSFVHYYYVDGSLITRQLFRHSKVKIYHATLPNPYYVDKLLRMKIEVNGLILISASYYENLIIQM